MLWLLLFFQSYLFYKKVEYIVCVTICRYDCMVVFLAVVCSAFHFALNILKPLVFFLPQHSFCTSPAPMCGFRWRVSVMDAFYVVFSMLHLTGISFVYNFTAEYWYSESRKWYGCCEWGWSHWYEHWWGLCATRVFHNKSWIRGEPCFEIFFIVVMVVHTFVYVDRKSVV